MTDNTKATIVEQSAIQYMADLSKVLGDLIGFVKCFVYVILYKLNIFVNQKNDVDIMPVWEAMMLRCRPPRGAFCHEL